MKLRIKNYSGDWVIELHDAVEPLHHTIALALTSLPAFKHVSTNIWEANTEEGNNDGNT